MEVQEGGTGGIWKDPAKKTVTAGQPSGGWSGSSKTVKAGQPSGGWSGSSSSGSGGGDGGSNTPDSAGDPVFDAQSYLDTINANYLARLRGTPGAMSSTNKYLTFDPYAQRLAGEGGMFGYGGSAPPTGAGAPGIAGGPNEPVLPGATVPPYGGGGYPGDYGDSGGGGGGRGDGGGGGGEGGWKEWDIEGHPDWWKGLANMGDERTQFASYLNALIPTNSGMDQRTGADVLSRMYTEQFGSFNPMTVGEGGFNANQQLNPELENYFLGENRSSQVLAALDAMEKATGTTAEKRGAGGAWLRSLAGAMNQFGDYGNTTSLTGTQRDLQKDSVNALMGEAKSDPAISQFAQLARMLWSPFFTNQQFNPQTETPTGTQFGATNPSLF